MELLQLQEVHFCSCSKLLYRSLTPHSFYESLVVDGSLNLYIADLLMILGLNVQNYNFSHPMCLYFLHLESHSYHCNLITSPDLHGDSIWLFHQRDHVVLRYRCIAYCWDFSTLKVYIHIVNSCLILHHCSDQVQYFILQQEEVKLPVKQHFFSFDS